MEPVALTFIVLFGGTYGIGSIFLNHESKLHENKLARRDLR